jgi:hypothetical protein
MIGNIVKVTGDFLRSTGNLTKFTGDSTKVSGNLSKVIGNIEVVTFHHLNISVTFQLNTATIINIYCYLYKITNDC